MYTHRDIGSCPKCTNTVGIAAGVPQVVLACSCLAGWLTWCWVLLCKQCLAATMCLYWTALRCRTSLPSPPFTFASSRISHVSLSFCLSLSLSLSLSLCLCAATTK